jgi:hypothetical protein
MTFMCVCVREREREREKALRNLENLLFPADFNATATYIRPRIYK